MTIEYKGYQIEGGEKGNDGVIVTVRFRVADIPAAEQLITGCRSLGARSKEQPAELRGVPRTDDDSERRGNVHPEPKAEEPKPRPKLAAVPTPPASAPEASAVKKDELAKEAPTQPANGNGKKKLTVTKEMREGTFRVVCSELAKLGYNNKAALLDILPKLREHVPSVKAVPDEQLQARVEAAVDILGLGN